MNSRSAKTIDHFRHAKRTKPSPHLNSEGVEIARKIGDQLEEYALVITSPRKRAVETAVAMGFAVEDTAEILKDLPEKVSARVRHDVGFGGLSELLRSEVRIEPALEEMRRFLHEQLARIREGERLLLVSHGGLVEWTALALLPEVAGHWGGALDKCEGIRMEVHSSGEVVGKPLRLSDFGL